jgi:hypothetical protein
MLPAPRLADGGESWYESEVRSSCCAPPTFPGPRSALLLALLIASPGAEAVERIHTFGRRLSVSADQTLVVTDAKLDRVALYDVSGERPRKLGEFGEQGDLPGLLMGPHGAVILGADELVVADTFNHRLQSFRLAALRAGKRPALVRVWAEAGGYVSGMDGPMALALGTSGEPLLYVADTRNGRVLAFGPDGRRRDFTLGRPGAALSWPSALALDASGGVLLVAEEGAARVSAFDTTSGRPLFEISGGEGEGRLGSPCGLALLPNGDLLVSDQARRRVLRYALRRDGRGQPTGASFVRAFGREGRQPGEWLYPQAVAADARGRVYVCEGLDDRCQVFDAQGRYLAPLGDTWEPPEWVPPSAETGRAPARGAQALCSQAGTFGLSIASSPDPMPLNEPFDLSVEVRLGCGRTAALAEDAELLVSGLMPEHRHGMNSEPRARRVGPGRFLVAGALLHMPGLWELHFDVTRQGVLERAQLALELE